MTTLLQTLKPFLEVTKVSDLRIEEDTQTSSVTLDGWVTIEEKVGDLRGPGTLYTVSFVSYLPATRESPEDADVVDEGTYSTPGGAVIAALHLVLMGRVSRYEDQLADNDLAESFLAPVLLDGS
jgi:hypothetical protein